MNLEEIINCISLEEDNEEHVLKLLQGYTLKTAAQQLNTFFGPYNESVLMWAVWRLKVRVVTRLIELGANPLLVNDALEGVSTYWRNDSIITCPQLAIEMAQLLHNHGVRLDRASMFSYSICKRARKNNVTELISVLEKLGYNVAQAT